MKADSLEGAWLDLYFTNVDVANVGDATGLRGSTTVGSLYFSLHTAYPGEGGSQTTSESAYGAYARKAVARTTAEWTRTGSSITTDNVNSFPACTSGSETVYFIGIGRSSAGAGTLDYIAPLGTEQGEALGENTGDLFTLPGHTLANDDRVAIFALPKVALPAGPTAGTIYWVVGVSGITFQISTTQGGAAVALTTDGVALVYKMQGLAISAGITPQVAAGAITIRED